MTVLSKRLRRDDQESRYSPRLLMTLGDMEGYYEQAIREQRQGTRPLDGEGHESPIREEKGGYTQERTTEARPSV